MPSTAPAGPRAGHFHAVRFYQDDESLCRIVAEFVGDGLAGGEPGVLITTPAHRDGIFRQLRARAVDPERHLADNELVFLDADEALAGFMVDDEPDPVLFREKVGAALRVANGGRGTVRAYGEMVDTLWKRGEQDAAIRLEILWNDLASTRAFSLLCGYAVGNFYKQGAYDEICRLHSHVLSDVEESVAS